MPARRLGRTQVAPTQARHLAARFADLRRRFVFEYYPWYDTDPWFHWNDADHVPPLDVTASSMPWLGPYDTYDLRVL